LKHVPIINTTYNYYTVFSEETKLSNDKRIMFEVKCSCNKIEFKLAKDLISGRCKSCKSCSSKRTAKAHPLPTTYKGIGDLTGSFYSYIKRRAIQRDLEFVSKEFLHSIFVKQEGKCALTGLDITLSKKRKNSNPNWDFITASLDRIDSNKGYTEDNVWWVHKTVNRLKNNYSVEELLYWCNLISSHGNLEPSSTNDMKVVEKVQRLTGEKSNNKPDTKSHLLNEDEDIV